MNGVKSISRKSKYLNVPDLDKLHKDCKNWLSEIAFWKDEIAFLKSVPHRYLERITDEDQIINLKFLLGQINGELNGDLRLLEEKTVYLENMIVGLVQNSFIYNEQKCREEHKRLSMRIENYRDLFEQTRDEMKDIVKTALRKPKTSES